MVWYSRIDVRPKNFWCFEHVFIVYWLLIFLLHFVQNLTPKIDFNQNIEEYERLKFMLTAKQGPILDSLLG